MTGSGRYLKEVSTGDRLTGDVDSLRQMINSNIIIVMTCAIPLLCPKAVMALQMTMLIQRATAK
jgi:hypothetical protein